MLVAGHETTGSVLTWTLYLLANNPTQMRKVSQAVGGVACEEDVSVWISLTLLWCCIAE